MCCIIASKTPSWIAVVGVSPTIVASICIVTRICIVARMCLFISPFSAVSNHVACTFAIFAPWGVIIVTCILVSFFLPEPAVSYDVPFDIAKATPSVIFVGIIIVALIVLFWVILEIVAIVVILVVLVIVLGIFVL